MPRKLNKNLVGALVLGVTATIIVIGIVLLASLPGQNPERYAAEAEEFQEQGEYELAAKTFVRAFQKDTAENPEYLVKAAACAIDDGDLMFARQLIGHARVKDPRLQSALESGLALEFELAELTNTATQWNRILDLADEMLQIEENKEIASAHHALGKACIRLISQDASFAARGEAALRRAYELDPSNMDIVSDLADRLWRTGARKKTEGEVAAAEALKQDRTSLIASAIEQCKGPDSKDDLADLTRLQGRFLILDDSVDEGLAILEELASAETTRADSLLLLGTLHAQLYRGRRIAGLELDLEKAAQYLERALEVDSKDYRVYQRLGRIYGQQYEVLGPTEEGNAKLAKLKKLYERGLEEIERSKHFRKFLENNARVVFIEGLYLQSLKEAQAAQDESVRAEHLASVESWIERLKEERSGESLEVRYAMARLFHVRGELIAATKEAEAAQRLAGNRFVLGLEKLLSELYMKQRQWGSAQESLGRALERVPQDVALHVAMGQVLLRLGRPTDALRHLRPASHSGLREALGRNNAAIQLRIDAYRRLGQFEYAEEESRRLGEDSPEDKLRLAAIMMWEERYGEAETKIKEVLDAAPENDSAIRAMLSLYQQTDRTAEARAFLDGLIAGDPNNRKLQRLAISLTEIDDEATRDDRILKFLKEEDDEFTRFISLANFYDQREKKDEAKNYLDKAEQLQPDNPELIERQFGFSLANKDWQQAEHYAARHAELNADGTEGKIAAGRLALARGELAKSEGRPAEAKDLYEQAIDQMNLGVQKYPSYSQGWTYLAHAYMAADQVEEAKKELRQALRVNPANGYANRTLARVAALEEDENTEREYLAAAARTLPNDPWIQGRLRIYREKDNPEEGVAAREKIRRAKPDDLENLVLLARLYSDSRVGAYEKAAAAYTHALKLSENDLALAREVAAFYGSEDVSRPAEGDKLLNDLLREEQDVKQKALIAASLGQFYEGQKALATADRKYRLAVSLDASKDILEIAAQFYSRTGRLNDALEYYERALGLGEDGSDFSRRILSSLISINLGMGELDRAKEQIDHYVKAYPNDSQGMVYEGAYHRLGGDTEKAHEAFNRHLEKDPDNAVALYQRGRLFLLLGQWESAIEDLKRAKTFDPDGFDYGHRIALADAYSEAKRGEEAITELRLILEDHSEQQAVAEALVDKFTRAKPPRFIDAENLIYRYMRRFPRNYKWPTMLARLGELTQDLDKAIEGYEKAAEVGQFQPETIRSLFNTYRLANRAGAVIQYASEKVPSRLLDRVPEALSVMAWAYAQSGQEEKCFSTFNRAFSATGANFTTYTRVVAEMVGVLGREKALERILAQVEAEPSNVHKQRALVYLYQMNGDFDGALAVCERMLQLSPRDSDAVFAHLAKGMLMAALGRLEEAKLAYEEVLKLDPNQALTLNNLAYLLAEKLKSPPEAIAYAKQASRLQPNDANVLDTYGWILALNQRLGEATGALLRALEVDRTNVDAMFHLGRVYLMREDFDEARFRLQQAKTEADDQGRSDYLPKIIKALEEVDRGASG